MLNKSVNGYTATMIDRALAGLDLPVLMRVRGELLDADLAKLYDLVGLLPEGSVSWREDQPIKGGAQVKFLEMTRDSQHLAPLASYASIITAQNRLFYLRLGETTGNFSDFTGNGRTFTANGSPTYSIGSLLAGDSANNSVRFPAAGTYASIADAAWMDTTPITISFWIKFTEPASNPFRLMQREAGAPNQAWVIAHTVSGLFFRVYISGSGIEFLPSPARFINDGLPHHIVCMYDGSYGQIYLDGARIVKTAQTGNVDAVAAPIEVPGQGAPRPCTIDEFGMLNRILTPKEIRDEYQAGSNQLNEVLFDKDRGDRLKIWYGVRMPTAGTDGGGYAEWPQIVALLPTLDRQYSTTGITDTITVQDQTRVLSDYKFAARTTLQSAGNFLTADTATSKGVLAIARLTGLDTAGWSVASTTLTASADIDFEIGSSALDAINYLLAAINYRPIRFTGSGSAVIEPNVLDINRVVVDTLTADATSVISAADDTTLSLEQRKVINQTIVFNANPDVADIQATVTNDKARSPTSTVFLPTRPKLIQTDVPDSNTATAIGQQQLSDETARWAKRLRVKTLPRPIHESRDKLRLIIPQLGINAEFVEDEWTLPFGPELMEHQFLSVVDVTT